MAPLPSDLDGPALEDVHYHGYYGDTAHDTDEPSAYVLEVINSVVDTDIESEDGGLCQTQDECIED